MSEVPQLLLELHARVANLEKVCQVMYGFLDQHKAGIMALSGQPQASPVSSETRPPEPARAAQQAVAPPPPAASNGSVTVMIDGMPVTLSRQAVLQAKADQEAVQAGTHAPSAAMLAQGPVGLGIRVIPAKEGEEDDQVEYPSMEAIRQATQQQARQLAAEDQNRELELFRQRLAERQRVAGGVNMGPPE